jgi:hypothetical protein
MSVERVEAFWHGLTRFAPHLCPRQSVRAFQQRSESLQVPTTNSLNLQFQGYSGFPSFLVQFASIPL